MKQELLDFLGSFKNAESLDEDLRKTLSIPTGLEEVVVSAASQGRCVFVTGAAGSGKTHLLRGLNTPSKTRIVGPGDACKSSHILVIPDATELTVQERIGAVLGKARNREGTVVAINEGPLRETARARGGELFAEASDLLMRGRRGIAGAYDARLPTVVDMGAFDPIVEGAIAEILRLDDLVEVVQDCECEHAPEDCPRRRAWEFLEAPSIRERIASILRLVLLVEPQWSFRDLWDLVADLVLGGSCSDDPPTSAWFWRLFFGDSRLALRLAEVAHPAGVPLPGIDQRLWFGAWDSLELETVGGSPLMPLSRPFDAFERFLWLKTQVLLASADEKLHTLLGENGTSDLRRAVLASEVGPLVYAINRYMTYDMLPARKAQLQLWVDHNVERRTERAHGQIHVGDAPVDEFVISPAHVVINHPTLGSDRGFSGSTRHLVHADSEAYFELAAEKIALLEQRRSFRQADRRHTDLECDLYRFFDRVLQKRMESREVGVLTCDFSSLQGSYARYSVSVREREIEETR